MTMMVPFICPTTQVILVLLVTAHKYISFIKLKISTSSSFNIFTRQQVCCDEKMETVFPVTGPAYKVNNN